MYSIWYKRLLKGQADPPERRTGREEVLAKPLNGSLDDVVLSLSADVHKVGTVTGYTYNHFLVLFRILLSSPQRSVIHHVELDVIEAQIRPGLHVRLPQLVALFPGKLSRRKALVEKECPSVGHMVEFPAGFQNCRGSFPVQTGARGNTAVIEGVTEPTSIRQRSHDTGIMDVPAHVLRQERPVVVAGH